MSALVYRSTSAGVKRFALQYPAGIPPRTGAVRFEAHRWLYEDVMSSRGARKGARGGEGQRAWGQLKGRASGGWSPDA